MAEKIPELTGEAREKRIAELKRKMQEAAKKAQAARSASEPMKVGEEAPAPGAVSETTPETPGVPAQSSEPVAQAAETLPASGNGATAPEHVAATTPVVPKSRPSTTLVQSEPTNAEMNRREFLTYAWGAALGLLVLETGAASFFFMYPRFRAGEFGGQFFAGPESALPEHNAAPQPNPTGKYWLVTTAEDEPKALYMVCTHLGCLYKWEPSNGRFECPCHGSKFTHDGWYIEGPAPRSLDYFETEIVDGIVVVDTGKKNNGSPAAVSPARAEVS